MKIEVRNAAVYIDGYVNVVERDSRVMLSPTHGKFVEQVRAKTFQRAIEKAQDIDLLYNHNPNRKLGSISQGNLRLWEDNIGLRAQTEINDPDIVQKAEKGELRGWSFAFREPVETWEPFKNGISRRYLEDISMPEVSILDVTPAYIATSLEVRSENTNIIEYRSFEEEEQQEEQREDEEEEEHEDEDSGKNDDKDEHRYSLDHVEIEIELTKLKLGTQ